MRFDLPDRGDSTKPRLCSKGGQIAPSTENLSLTADDVPKGWSSLAHPMLEDCLDSTCCSWSNFDSP